MRKVFLFILIFALTCITFSQSNFAQKSLIGKYYWTKFVLATDSNCKIEITANDISPNQEYCKFQNHFEANSKIKLKELNYQKQWARLTFVDENDDKFAIFLQNDSKLNFKKSFDLAFSTKSISEETSCDVKTKLDVIRKLGFPTEVQRNGNFEIWSLWENWVGGFPCGFDTTQIEIKKGVVTKISGTI